MENLLEKFENQINETLDNCSSLETPTVCNFISTPEGREKINELIQKRVIQGNFTIAQAVVSIEQEFNPNSYAE